MKDLYKGRYLIGWYDKDDNCIGVFSSIKELNEIKKTPNLYSIINHILNKKEGENFTQYRLIDCLEKHEDIFQEEDEIFLKECPEKVTNKMKAKSLGLSLKTYYRKKGLLGEKEL